MAGHAAGWTSSTRMRESELCLCSLPDCKGQCSGSPAAIDGSQADRAPAILNTSSRSLVAMLSAQQYGSQLKMLSMLHQAAGL